MKELHKVLDFCSHHQTILGFSIVSLLTVASEQIFSSVVFKCPCNSGNMLYGYSFLLAPAFVLFLLGFMVNPRTWRLLTGKCSCKNKPVCSSGRTCICCSPWGTCNRYCQVLLPMTAKALVAPLTWIAAALFGANFYECAASGSSWPASYFCKHNGTDDRELRLEMPCNETIAAELSRKCLSLHAQSQVIGWFVIAIIMTVALISKCCRHYCSTCNYLQLKFWKIYTEEERELFEKKAKEHATKLAERNTNCFFEATDRKPFHIPPNKDWQAISVVTPFNSQGQVYSMLHMYVNNKLNEGGHGCTDSANGNEAQTGVTDHANGNEARTSVTDRANGNEARTSVTDCANGNEAQTGVTDRANGNEAQISVTDHANRNEAQTSITDSANGNEAQTSVTGCANRDEAQTSVTGCANGNEAQTSVTGCANRDEAQTSVTGCANGNEAQTSVTGCANRDEAQTSVTGCANRDEAKTSI